MGQVITSGQSSTVPSGSTVGPTDVQSGGTLTVLAGGVADDTIIEGGGQVYNQGVVSGVSAVNGFLDVQAGGVASGVVFSRGYLNVDPGGTIVGETVSGTIDANDDGGFLSVQFVQSGGFAVNTFLDQGGFTEVYGTEINTTASGRSNNLLDNGTVVYSGTNAVLSASVTGYGLLALTGAVTRVTISDSDQPHFFGSFTGAAVIGAGTTLQLDQPDSLGSGTVLFSPTGGGTLQIEGNSSPPETMADFVSGNEIILDGTVISGAAVSDGLVQLFLTNGGEDDIIIPDAQNGIVEITSGVDSTILKSDLIPTVFTSDGDINMFTPDFIEDLGLNLFVGSGGSAVRGFVDGATLDVQSGGTVNDTYVGSGGSEDVRSGGNSTDDHILNGAQQTVDTGGPAKIRCLPGACWSTTARSTSGCSRTARPRRGSIRCPARAPSRPRTAPSC